MAYCERRGRCEEEEEEEGGDPAAAGPALELGVERDARRARGAVAGAGRRGGVDGRENDGCPVVGGRGGVLTSGCAAVAVCEWADGATTELLVLVSGRGEAGRCCCGSIWLVRGVLGGEMTDVGLSSGVDDALDGSVRLD